MNRKKNFVDTFRQMMYCASVANPDLFYRFEMLKLIEFTNKIHTFKNSLFTQFFIKHVII